MTEEVPEREARSFDTLQGTTIFITQRDGSFYAYQNLCPHLQTQPICLAGFPTIRA